MRNLASDRLYQGEVRSVQDAFSAYLAAMRFERRTFVGDEDFERDARVTFDQAIASAEAIQKQYAERVSHIERALFEEWAKSADETIRLFGEAGLSGDFSGLAI